MTDERANRLLLASIHDVSPRFESEVDALLICLRPYVGERLTLLVVPNHWADAPIVPGSPIRGAASQMGGSGIEIFLHGYYHRDEARPWRRCETGSGAPHDRRRRRVLRPFDERRRRPHSVMGRSLLEDITGRPNRWIRRSGWLYGEGAREAMIECAIPLAEDHLRVWSPASGAQLAWGPVITSPPARSCSLRGIPTGPSSLERG